jgi:outer membrane biosynthesis protein TonB
MSLIQEALKRQQQESEGTLPPDAPNAEPSEAAPKPPPPPAPSPTPSPSTAPSPKPKKPALVKHPDEASEETTTVESEQKPTRVLPALLGVILLLILLLAAVGWAIFYGLQYFGMGATETDAQVPTETVTTEPVAPHVATTPPAASPAADGKTPSTMPNAETPNVTAGDMTPSAMEPTTPPADSTENSTPVESAEAAPEAATETQPPTVAPPDKAPRPAAETPVTPPEPQPEIEWPPVKLSGIVGSGNTGAVMINGKVVGINELIDGIRVLSIEAKGALLEYKGDKRFLRVGKMIQ